MLGVKAAPRGTTGIDMTHHSFVRRSGSAAGVCHRLVFANAEIKLGWLG
jgi:hypothetical protein